MSNSNSSRTGNFFEKIYRGLDFLFFMFVGLKMAGLIKWSWWEVSKPMFAELAIVVLALIILGVGQVVTMKAEADAKAKK